VVAQETVSGADPGELAGLDAPAAATRRLRWSRPVAVRAAAAIAAGLLMFLAFPPDPLAGHGTADGLWPLAPIGVAVLTLAIRGVSGRRGAWLGLLAGLAFFLPLLDWVRVIGLDGWAGLGLVQAAYYAPMGAATAVVTRLRAWPLWTAALWVAQEYVRGRWPFGGLPWGRLAFSQTAGPFTPYAAIGGAPLVTFVTALIGALIAYAVLRTPWAARPRTAWLAAAAALAGVVVLGLAALLVPVGTKGKDVTVAVIQGNVPRLGLDFLGQREAVLNNHVNETLKLAADIKAGKVAQPQLVVWPENSSDIDPYTDPGARARIEKAVSAVGVPVLVGAVVDAPDNPDKVQNRGIVWDPVTGPGQYYTKRHPVPFGEYIPFRSLLTKIITRFQMVPRDFEAGTWPGLMQLGPAKIGDVICFEVAYDGIVRDVAGAQLLVVQTNNATYGHTSLPWQQIAMSRLRAVEHGKSVLVAATSGITAVVKPDGAVLGESTEFTPYYQVARVPARDYRTLADRLAEWPEWVLVALGAAALLYGVRESRRNRKA
jgi:apolipoprotein N-acyltransferase